MYQLYHSYVWVHFLIRDIFLRMIVVYEEDDDDDDEKNVVHSYYVHLFNRITCFAVQKSMNQEEINMIYLKACCCCRHKFFSRFFIHSSYNRNFINTYIYPFSSSSFLFFSHFFLPFIHTFCAFLKWLLCIQFEIGLLCIIKQQKKEVIAIAFWIQTWGKKRNMLENKFHWIY